MPAVFPGSSLLWEISGQWDEAIAKARTAQAAPRECRPSAHRVGSEANADERAQDTSITGILLGAWHGVLSLTCVSLFGLHAYLVCTAAQ